MSFTLMEGAIVVVLLWIAWSIGRILAPWIVRRWRDRHHPDIKPPDRNKPTFLT